MQDTCSIILTLKTFIDDIESNTHKLKVMLTDKYNKTEFTVFNFQMPLHVFQSK